MGRLLPLLAALSPSLAFATTYPMTLHKVVDDQGIHAVAYRYLAPKGWKVDTKLGWTDAILQPTIFAAQADSPDRRFGYSFLPGLDLPFGGTTGGHGMRGPISGQRSGVQPPSRLSDWLLQSVKGNKDMDDVRIVRRTDQPLSPAQLGEHRSFGMVSTLEIAFTRGGRPMFEVMSARMDGLVAGNPNAEFQAFNGDWEVVDAFAVYGPKGEERKAMRFFSLAVPTYTATPAFIKARGAYILALNHEIQANIARIGEMSQIAARLDRQKEDAIMGRYHSQQAARDRAMSGFCDYIGDVDRYHTADGAEMQLASGYKDAWTNQAGDVVLSDDAGYDPNSGSGGGWSRLQRTH